LKLKWLLPTTSGLSLFGTLQAAVGAGIVGNVPSSVLVWTGIGFATVGFLGLASLGKALLSHLETSRRFLAEFSEGDLSNRMPIDSKIEELGAIARAINSAGEAQCAMVNELREATSALDREAESFRVAFQDIRTQSRQSMDASATVAAAVEELSAGMSSMAKEGNHVDHIAAETLQRSRKVQELSTDTSHLIVQQQSTLQETSQSLHHAIQATEALLVSGREIAGLAASIQDVAKRTRLLALNASIEAVRAGRAGAGFSVVAQEVKELARQSGELALNIQSQVNAVATGTEEVALRIQTTKGSLGLLVEESASARESAEEQSRLSHHSQQSLETTSQSISHVARTIGESKVALDEIAHSTVDVETMSRSVETSLANASTGITDLQRLAKSFQGTVREIKVRPPFFPWTEDLKLGIPRMDDQHKVLLRLINRVADLSESGGGGAAIRIILGQLLDYTKFHFGDEESLMKHENFPGIDGHHALHVAFISEVERIVALAGSGEQVDAGAILAMLKEWLIKHIQGTDKQYARHILGGSKR
jgi:hemerythrin-like metal-binding protein